MKSTRRLLPLLIAVVLLTTFFALWVPQGRFLTVSNLLDLAQHAVSADCQLTGFPYVLARAHELAVVTHAERSQFEEMLGQFMLRNGLTPATSFKAGMKELTAGKGR